MLGYLRRTAARTVFFWLAEPCMPTSRSALRARLGVSIGYFRPRLIANLLVGIFFRRAAESRAMRPWCARRWPGATLTGGSRSVCQ